MDVIKVTAHPCTSRHTNSYENINKKMNPGAVITNQARRKVLKSLKLEKQYSLRQNGRNSVKEQQVNTSLVSIN